MRTLGIYNVITMNIFILFNHNNNSQIINFYVLRMKLTEEEEAAREISQLFPSSREDDFGDLEAPDALDYVPPTPTKKVEDPMKLKSVEIEEICQLHSLIVREQAQNHWLLSEPVAEDNFIALLSDRLGVFSTLIDGLHGHCEKQLDQFSIGSYLLAADLQTADIFKPIKENCHYDFYRDTNISESKQCVPLLNAIQKRVDELLSEWPDHPTLLQVRFPVFSAFLHFKLLTYYFYIIIRILDLFH